MTVTLIADGGAGVGLGHLSRSSALASALEALGVEVRCLANGAAAPVERYGVLWRPRSGREALGSAPVVLDSYLLDPAELRVPVASLVLFHDGPEGSPHAGLVISSIPDATGAGPDVVLSGPEYACLGPDYWQLPRREICEVVRRVLITMGGGGTADGQLLEVTREALPGAVLTLVRGPDVRTEAPEGIEVLDSPASLRAPLLDADLVLTGAGQTLLEAAATAAPIVAVILAENQRRGAEELQRRDAIRLADLGDKQRIGDCLAELGRSAELRGELSEQARAAVDGRGAQRIAARVVGLPGAL